MTVFRLRKGRAVFRGSRDHLALRLVALGFDRGRAVRWIYLVSGWLAAIALLLVRVELGWAVIACSVVGAAALWTARKLSRVEMTEGAGGDESSS